MKLSEQEAGEGASGWGDEGVLGWEKSKQEGTEAGNPPTYRFQAPLSPAVGSSSLPRILLTLPGTCSKWGPWRNCQGQGSMGIVDAESSPGGDP